MKKVFIIGSGIERIKRGFEVHLVDLYNNLVNSTNNKVFLVKGGGHSTVNEIRVTNFARNSFPAKAFGYITGKHPYYMQNTTFSFGLIPYLIKYTPDIIYLGEPVICRLLIKWRKLSGQQFKIIFFTGGQSLLNGLTNADRLHFVSPLCMEDSRAKEIPEENKFLIPHFLNLPNQNGIEDKDRDQLKKELNIPAGTTIILSVGAIDCSVKRMDYLIMEVSKLREPVFLIILGEEESETKKVKTTALNHLQQGSYIIKTVNRDCLWKYYSVSDIFVLASLIEGFGMVYIEALSYGLSVVAHDFLVSRYVLKDHGFYADLSKEGELSNQLKTLTNSKSTTLQKESRKRFVYDNYSWDVLKSCYLNMFCDLQLLDKKSNRMDITTYKT